MTTTVRWWLPLLLSLASVLSANGNDTEEIPVATAAVTTSANVAAAADLNTATTTPGTKCCETCTQDRPQDQVWLVSTRQLGCAAIGQASPNWRITRWQDRCWNNASDEDLFAANGQMRTIVYVHGNRVDSAYAVEGGLRVYRNLVACASDEPIRFIIWSWCSDRLAASRPVRDARVKADLADHQAVILGRFLGKFTPEDRIGLIGFSYGCRVITGGLHLLGGGRWLGYTVPLQETPSQFRVVLWAAAENNDWLVPGHAHGCAINACPVWLNMVNCDDEALRFYPRVDRSSSREALGYTGVANKCAIEARGVSFRECTVQHLVGSEHRSAIYPLSAGVMRETRQIVLEE